MSSRSNLVAMSTIGVLFFIFGFVTWLNGSLIPFLKVICELDEFEALFVTFAFYIAYTVMALPMSFILQRVGYKNSMAIGLAIMSVGSLIFIPAAIGANFVIFLIALFLLGTGLTILQTASNPFVIYMGPPESAAMRISIMGLINKSAGVLAPLLFTAYILLDVGDLDSLMSIKKEVIAYRLIIPYLIMAVVLGALALLIKFSSLPEINFKKYESVSKKNIFEFPRVVLGAIALFFYVGIEVVAGDTIGLYGQYLGVNNYTMLTSYTMVFMVIGYLVGILCIPKILSQEKALIGSAILGALFLIGVVSSSAESYTISEIFWGWSGIGTIPNSVAFVAFLGFANALIWPTIWPLALEGLGKYTAQGSALLIMAIAGGAVIPLLVGKIASASGDMQSTYLIGLICYTFIFFYAFKWHKITKWKSLW